MAMVRKAEAVQVWNADVRAILLHPGIRSHLRAQLLVHCARVLDFSKLVWHRTAKDELLVTPGRTYLDGYTNIEAATNPSLLRRYNAGVVIIKPQMVFNNCLDGLSLVPKRLVELYRCLEVCCFADDICVFLQRRLVCDGSPVIYVDGSRHDTSRPGRLLAVCFGIPGLRESDKCETLGLGRCWLGCEFGYKVYYVQVCVRRFRANYFLYALKLLLSLMWRTRRSNPHLGLVRMKY
jgi:hypothetical protein